MCVMCEETHRKEAGSFSAIKHVVCIKCRLVTYIIHCPKASMSNFPLVCEDSFRVLITSEELSKFRVLHHTKLCVGFV